MLTLLLRENSRHPWARIFQAETPKELEAERRKYLDNGIFGNNLYTLADVDPAETIQRMNQQSGTLNLTNTPPPSPA